jgi:hypothetical protein
MKHVGFIISTYWELIEFFASTNTGFFTLALVCFCFGFGIRRVFGRRPFNEIRDEMEELQTRLKGAESLLSGDKLK